MYEIHLGQQMTDKDQEMDALLHDLQRLGGRSSQYEISVVTPQTGDRCRYVFVTTSKDIHLWLGQLHYGAHIRLCKMFETAFQQHGDSHMRFSFEPKEGQEKPRILFIARTIGNDLYGSYIMYHM
jgi:hypothetical protein